MLPRINPGASGDSRPWSIASPRSSHRPLYGAFAIPANVVDALIYLQIADYEIEVARGVLPPQVYSSQGYSAGYAAVHAYLTNLAESIYWGLKPLH